MRKVQKKNWPDQRLWGKRRGEAVGGEAGWEKSHASF